MEQKSKSGGAACELVCGAGSLVMGGTINSGKNCKQEGGRYVQNIQTIRTKTATDTKKALRTHTCT
jgi:hypothetical protein